MKAYWIFAFFFIAKYGACQNSDQCKCVPYYLCSANGTVITTGKGLTDPRFGLEKNGTEIRNKRDVPKCSCQCPESSKVCCYVGAINETVSIKAVLPTGCGFANPDGTGFKLSNEGTNVAFGEFPWMVVILVDGESLRCGGTLIHPSVVLTAAHCVTKRQTYTVRAGEWDSSNTREVLAHQNRMVSSIKIHEDYYPPLQHNDIALLFMESPFTLENHIQVACLPPSDTVVSNIRCIATGWGKDKFGGEGKYPAILKKLSLPMVNRAKCEENLKPKLGSYFNLHKSAVCAGGGKNEDTCIGDGGGPLVCPISDVVDRYQQIGITSWGVGCNQENVPGVYTNIPVLRNWIDKNVREKNFNTDKYQY